MRRCSLAGGLGAGALLIGALAGAGPRPVVAQTADVTCTGTLAVGSYASVTVPPGATCTLPSGATVSGTVTVQEGATLYLQSGATLGNLVAVKSKVVLVGGTAPAQAGPVCTSVSCQRNSPSSLSEVSVAESPQTGAYLTAGGMTLYTLSSDQPGSSVCTLRSGCFDARPPFVVPSGGLKVGSAGLPATFDLVMRGDGTQQVGYNGKPLYFYSGDMVRGDVNGNGVTDQWGTWSVAKE